MRSIIALIALVVAGCSGGGGAGGSGYEVRFVGPGSFNSLEYGQTYTFELTQGGVRVNTAVIEALMTPPAVNTNAGGGLWTATIISPDPGSGVIRAKTSGSVPNTQPAAWVPIRSDAGATFRCTVLTNLADREYQFRLPSGVAFLPRWDTNPTNCRLPLNISTLVLPARSGFTQVDVGGQMYSLPAEVPVPPQTANALFTFNVTYQ